MDEKISNKADKYLAKLLLAVTVAFALYIQFHRIGYFNIIQWDESRLAVNAAEMSMNHNWLVTSFENQPDLYNTKPPLMIWLQTLCIHLFGLNETSIRLPSALAGFFSIILTGFILYRHSKDLLISSVGMLLLTVSGGFIQLHGSMTGDFDSLLSLLVLLCFNSFDRYLSTKNTKYFNQLIIWQSLALLCKSAAGLIPLPVWIGFLFLEFPWKTALKNSLKLGTCLIPFIIYCGIREMASAGYLAAIWNNDFHGRFSKALEGHTSEWYYYIVNLFTFRYSYFIWLLPLVLGYDFKSKNRIYRFYSLGFIAYMTLLTLAKTRIHWYDMPLLPLLSILIALFLFEIMNKISNPKLRLLFTAVILTSMIPAIIGKYRFITHNEGLLLDLGHYELSTLMKEHKGKAKYIANWYDAEFYFYTKTNKDIERGNFRQLKPGDTVLMGNLYRDSIPILYRYEVLKETGNARIVVIK